jgi:CheY-like chemotaxis protein
MPDKSSPKTVLVVDDEKLFLASLTEGMMEFADEFTVVTANNGRKALDELKRQEINLVVTDLKMPTMDGFQLLVHMMHEFPHIPIIVMTAFCTPEIERRVRDLDAFELLEKPIDLQLLASKIREGIQHSSEGHLKGIMLFSFLQLIEIEKKTCNLRVKSAGRKGNLYFSKGQLIDAVYGEVTGLDAAQEIVCWEDAEIEIMNVFKKIRKRIEKPLQNILMDAAKEKDEATLNNGSQDAVESWFEEPQAAAAGAAQQDFVQKHDPLTNETPSANMHFAETTQNGDSVFESSNLTQKEYEISMANNIQQSLDELLTLDGAMAAALVDSDSGMALGTVGGGVNLDVAAAGNTEVIKSKYKVMGNLGLKDKIEDILISLGTQYHLIRPLNNHTNLFFYLVLGREKSNLAMARFKLSEIENHVQL